MKKLIFIASLFLLACSNQNEPTYGYQFKTTKHHTAEPAQEHYPHWEYSGEKFYGMTESQANKYVADHTSTIVTYAYGFKLTIKTTTTKTRL